MASIIRIDGAGRVVIPSALRRKHHLSRGARIRIEDDGRRLVLVPMGEEACTEERNGLLVVDSRPADPDVDHRAVRTEFLDRKSR